MDDLLGRSRFLCLRKHLAHLIITDIMLLHSLEGVHAIDDAAMKPGHILSRLCLPDILAKIAFSGFFITSWGTAKPRI